METIEPAFKLLNDIKKDIIENVFFEPSCKFSGLQIIKKKMLSDIEKTLAIINDKFKKGSDNYLIEWDDYEFLTEGFRNKIDMFTSYAEKVDEEKEIYSPDYEENLYRKQLKIQDQKIERMTKEFIKDLLNDI